MKRSAWLWIALGCAAASHSEEWVDGLVEPVRDVWMGPQVGGRVETLHAGEGDRVEEGERVLSLDDRIESLEVDRRRVVLEDDSELRAARERVALLKEDVASTRELFETTASVSREELRRKEVELRLAEIDVGRLEQSERRERGELEIARARLDLNHIVAPFTGIVAELRVDEGESVQTGQSVVRLVDVSEAFLVMNLPAELARRLEVDQQVNLRFGPRRELAKPGRIDFISPVVDAASGLRTVKIRFVNDPPRVEPGRVGYWMTGETPDE